MITPLSLLTYSSKFFLQYIPVNIPILALRRRERCFLPLGAHAQVAELKKRALACVFIVALGALALTLRF